MTTPSSSPPPALLGLLCALVPACGPAGDDPVARAAELYRRGRLSDAARLHASLVAERETAASRRELGRIALRRALIPGREHHLLEARGELERAVTLDADDGEAWFLLGEVLQRLRAPAPARDALVRATERLGDGEPAAEAAVRLAMVRYELDELAEAAAALERALALEPASPDAWNVRGVLARRLGDGDAARAAFERALAIEPDHAEARMQLARLHLAAGDAATAERELERALEVSSDLTDALFELAELHRANGEDDEAVRLLRRTLDTRNNHVRANVALARLLIARGDEAALDEADRRLRVVLNRVNPDHAEAQRVRTELEAARERAGRRGEVR